MRLLLIEDDDLIAKTLIDSLSYSFAIDLVTTGQEGEEFANIHDYDIILLDFNLPDLTGAQVCQNLREQKIQTPILILTGRQQIKDKISAFDAGADDYLTKPFDITELRARIRALLRRHSSFSHTTVLTVGDLYLDLTTYAVWRGEREIVLRRKEFQLLEYLARNKGRIVTRDMILDHLWNNETEIMANTIDVHIKHLRDVIDKNHPKKLLHTIYGLGYKLG
jgi:DNA-binding response OmpR family regulator